MSAKKKTFLWILILILIGINLWQFWTVNKKLKVIQSNSKKEIMSIGWRADDLESKVDGLQSTVDDLKSDVDELRARLSNLESDVQDIDSRVRHLE